MPSPRFPAPLAVAACLVVASALAAPPAAGYAITLAGSDASTVLRWPTKNMAYHLHPDCSVDLPSTQCLDAVRDSFDQWTGHDCSDATFTELGTSTNKALTSLGSWGNGKSELAWIEDSAWVHGSFVLGVTGPTFSASGDIGEADIAFNGFHHTWSTDGATAGTMDVMNVAVHEIGHYFGLQHVLTGYDPTNPPTMAPQADPSLKSRDPEEEDILGLCFLYPKDGHTCQTDDDCPFILEQGPTGEFYSGSLACEGGLCGGVSNELPSGNSDIGEKCFSDADCAEGLTCETGFTGDGVCEQACVDDGDCPTGFDCNGGSCKEEGAPTEVGAIGFPCADAFDCFPNACIEGENGSFCRETCLGGGCPEGWSCEVIFFGIGGCVPDDGGYGLGEACSAPGDCHSALCKSGVCSEACEVLDSAAVCGEELVCARSSDEVGDGFCVPPGEAALGEACERDADCDSLFCVSEVCGVPCDPSTEVPCEDLEMCAALPVGPLGHCEPYPLDEVGDSGDDGDPAAIEGGGDGGGGGGCGGAPGTPWPLGLALGLAALAVLRRARAGRPASGSR